MISKVTAGARPDSPAPATGPNARLYVNEKMGLMVECMKGQMTQLTSELKHERMKGECMELLDRMADS